MSRGPGSLQKQILAELSQEPGGRLPWYWLRQRFPHQVRQKSFYRALRSLRRMGRIVDYEVDYGPGLGGRWRYIAIVPVYEVSGRIHFAYEADRELAALVTRLRRQLRTVASARGIRLKPSSIEPMNGTRVDAYRRKSAISD
jgi:hypothetical protein